MIKRILVGLAGTAFTPVAIQRAVALANAHGAEVTGVTVLDSQRLRRLPAPAVIGHPLEPSDLPIPLSPDSIEEATQRLEKSCKEAGVKCRLLRESGDAFTTFIDAARYHDLIVFGLGSLLKYAFPGDNPNDQLIRLIDAGVRPLIAVAEEFRPISRVLIAYSGSMESAKAMKRFVQMRLWPDAELKVMTFNPSYERAYELLSAAEEYCRVHGFKVCHQSNPGDPKVLLLPAATLWQADMIVMGNSARSVLMRQVLGDTLRTTLTETKVPLFLAQ